MQMLTAKGWVDGPVAQEFFLSICQLCSCRVVTTTTITIPSAFLTDSVRDWAWVPPRLKAAHMHVTHTLSHTRELFLRFVVCDA